MTNTDSIASRFTDTASIIGIMCKKIAPNDDSGRHGVVIPVDAYPLFPKFSGFNPDQDENYTENIEIRWPQLGIQDFESSRWKHYHRYPERRLTRLNPIINSLENDSLLLVGRIDNSNNRYEAIVIKPSDRDYQAILSYTSLQPNKPGCFIDLEWPHSNASSSSSFLDEFMDVFNSRIRNRWIATSGAGDRAVGETFESIYEVPRNNSQASDWKDLEFKCITGSDTESSKDKKLFLKEPQWNDGLNLEQRIKEYGYLDNEGRPRCFHRVTINPNKHGFSLVVDFDAKQTDLLFNNVSRGCWSKERLSDALSGKMKHTVFVTANKRGNGPDEEFKYTGVRYCTNPSINCLMTCLADGSANIQLRMGLKTDYSGFKNYGSQFRIKDSAIPLLFSRTNLLVDPRLR
ncbi:MvaI/BcnI family restriction endonuclease [Pirellulales bacterium]|nr:MvaI/BcnI family restriction endonuclease [Pirellulales bacterium]